MQHASLYFTAPGQVEVRAEPMPPLGPGLVLVKTLCSAISSGTELLLYRGQAPADLSTDATIGALTGTLNFPLKYGYSAVGRVVECGSGVEAVWQDRLVFAFNPHETHFIAEPANLIPLPTGLGLEDAVCLPNMETAINFLQDGAPLVGERVAVLGQGIVGLLTAQLLARLPLAQLVTFDYYPLRRQFSLQAGAHESRDPATLDSLPSTPSDFDLTYELSGSPAALNQAISLTGFSGRVLIGSWYGTKPTQLDLGGRFHRSRIRLIGSQVSSLNPSLTGRWTKERRLHVALDLLGQLQPSHYVTQRFPLAQATQAYTLLDQHPDEALQVLFTYED